MAAAQHLWMGGAAGLMTLAVMTRATLGHTGQALTAGPGTVGIYAALVVAVLARLAAGIWPDQAHLLHMVAGAGWILAFGRLCRDLWPVCCCACLLPSGYRDRGLAGICGGLCRVLHNPLPAGATALATDVADSTWAARLYAGLFGPVSGRAGLADRGSGPGALCAAVELGAVAALVPLVAMLPVCLILSLAIARPNPFSFGGARNATFDPARPGIVRLHRHPLLLALALWAAAHAVPNGDLAHLILFGTFAVFALLGTRLSTAGEQREMGRRRGRSLRREVARTPLWPPSLTGADALRLVAGLAPLCRADLAAPGC